MMPSRGEEYFVNDKGPMTEPCGTPTVGVWGVDFWSFMVADCVLFVKYVLNQFSADPLIPNLFDSSWKKCHG